MESRSWYDLNDRVIYEWQKYAGRYHEKTVDAHLAAIRDFEAFLQGKALGSVKTADAANYRNRLIELSQKPQEDGGLSKSTIGHRVSHLTSFFKWLCAQDGHRRLNRSIPDNFTLPKSARAKSLPREAKDFPNFEQACEMVKGMSRTSLVSRRKCAMVACAAVGALRAETITSLRIEDVEIDRSRFALDANLVKVKNSKSSYIEFFPGTEMFEEILIEWIDELRKLGYSGKDALFPHSKDLKRQSASRDLETERIRPMTSISALSEAFVAASAVIGKSYSPHAMKHCIAELGRKTCTTNSSWAWWVKNLSHDSPKTTEAYGKRDGEGAWEVLEGRSVAFGLGQDELSPEDMPLLLAFHESELPPTHPEYQRIQALFLHRQQERSSRR